MVYLTESSGAQTGMLINIKVKGFLYILLHFKGGALYTV
jgi:hypothetical protein